MFINFYPMYILFADDAGIVQIFHGVLFVYGVHAGCVMCHMCNIRWVQSVFVLL